MDRLLLLDVVLRLMAAGQLLLLALVTARGHTPRAIRATTVLLLLCVAAYLANVAPILNVHRSWMWPPIQLASQAAPLFLWLFALRIFERRTDWRLVAAAGLVTFLCWGQIVTAVYWTHRPPIAADIAQHVVSLLLAAHAIAIAIAARSDDLIEKRRTFRIGFVIIVGAQTLGIVLVETVFGYNRTFPGLMLLQSGTTFIAVMAFGAVLLSSNSELLFDAAAPAPTPPALSPADHVLKQKLDAAMAEGIYRETGLSIGVLADRLGVPEHRLRALINQRLGYRNFSDFLNTRRIEDARLWLADPARVSLPVLTIAMDLGYGSLAPFNRAFRESTGQTPTDYRRGAIVGSGNS